MTFTKSLLIATLLLVTILVLLGPNAYALTSTQRYTSGLSDGGQQAATDFQNHNAFNLTCDRTGAHTSDGQHTTLYCSGWANGYTAAWNRANQPNYFTPTQSVIPQVQGQTANLTSSSGQTSNNNFSQPQTSNSTLLCNSAVCDNSQFIEFAFDYDLNLLNIHIHKHSGVWHNERGVFVPWSALCNHGQGYLVQSCSNLIDSSGTLTQAGDRAVGCITNGAIITIAANTVHISPYTYLSIVKSALGLLAPMTGCDGLVNLNTIQTGPQLQSLLTALSNAAN